MPSAVIASMIDSPVGALLKRAEDALDAILPFDRRDQLAALLTDDDVANLKHLAQEGMGDNTLRATPPTLVISRPGASLPSVLPCPGRRPKACC